MAVETGVAAKRWSLFVLLTFLSAVALFPLYWMFATALRPPSEIFTRELQLWPSSWHPEQIAQAWRMLPFGDFYLNSLVIMLVGGIVGAVLDLLTGYAFARFSFRGRDALFALYLATIMIPAQVILVPQFLLVVSLGGINTYWAVIVPKLAEVFGIFLARQFLLTLPEELLQAARLDGANEWQIFTRIVVPLSKPLIAILLLFQMLSRWNDFAWPQVILKETKDLTVPVGLSLLFGQHATDWTSIMSMTLLSVLPPLLIFVFLQRWFVEGIARTGLKR